MDDDFTIMADEKESKSVSVPLSQGDIEEEDRRDPEDPAKSPPNSPNSSTRRVRFFLFSFLGSLILFLLQVSTSWGVLVFWFLGSGSIQSLVPFLSEETNRVELELIGFMLWGIRIT